MRANRQAGAIASERYRLSFLVGGLLAEEAAIAAPVFLRVGDWVETRQALDKGNLLHARAQASAVRTGRELAQRMETLAQAEVKHLVNAPSPDRKHLMWAAFCRHYALVAEFAEEVLRDRYLLGDLTLAPNDFERFVSSKALWHEELDAIKPSTRRKLRTNLFLAMRQADLLTAGGRILPALLSGEVAQFFNARQPNDIRFFPTSAPVGGAQ
jgi:hypothetical protein